MPLPSTRDFFRLAATQVRRQLIDLARQRIPRTAGLGEDASESTPHAGLEKPDSSGGPPLLSMWLEFHGKVEALPEQEREIWDLLWYQGLTQAEAAAVLGLSLATLKRRWLAARLPLLLQASPAARRRPAGRRGSVAARRHGSCPWGACGCSGFWAL